MYVLSSPQAEVGRAAGLWFDPVLGSAAAWLFNPRFEMILTGFISGLRVSAPMLDAPGKNT